MQPIIELKDFKRFESADAIYAIENPNPYGCKGEYYSFTYSQPVIINQNTQMRISTSRRVEVPITRNYTFCTGNSLIFTFDPFIQTWRCINLPLTSQINTAIRYLHISELKEFYTKLRSVNTYANLPQDILNYIMIPQLDIL